MVAKAIGRTIINISGCLSLTDSWSTVLGSQPAGSVGGDCDGFVDTEEVVDT